jgi:hypothetical protein
LREQIKAYCVEGLKQIDERMEKAKQSLEQSSNQNPAA